MAHRSLWQRNLPWMRWGITLLLTGALMTLWPAPIVRAATITVTIQTNPAPNPSGCNGFGACSLRDAVLYANLNPGTTIQLLALQTYTLTIPPDGSDNGYSGDLKPTANMTIMGGPSLPTIQGGGAGFGDRLFKIDNNATVTLSGVTLQNGNPMGIGGAIWVHTGTLNLTNVTVQNNQSSGDGGGILSEGVLSLTDCVVQGNTAKGGGGGIANAASILTVTGSFIQNNHANQTVGSGGPGGIGGGIETTGGLLTVDSSAVCGNTVTGGGRSGVGGGIYSTSTTVVRNRSTINNNSAPTAAGIDNESPSRLTITDSAVSGNTATDVFGGIFNAGDLTITRSTISGNTDGRGAGGIDNESVAASSPARMTMDMSTISGNSGGISLAIYFAATITNSTISGNNASTVGGGGSGYGITASFISQPSSFTSTATLTNDTISGNDVYGLSVDRRGTTITHVTFALNGADISLGLYGMVTARNSVLAPTSGGRPNCSRAITSGDYNLDSGTTCGLNQPHDLNSTPSTIGPLANNGGPTQTHALMAGSIAIDYVPAADGCRFGIATDQRGAGRPQGVACDIGAYEFIPPPPTITSVSPNGGPMTGGMRATITGGGFLPGATVTFGGVPATVLSVSGTAIVVTTPGHAPGSVTVVVTNPGQPPSNDPGTLVNGFTYIAPVPPPRPGPNMLGMPNPAPPSRFGPSVPGNPAPAPLPRP